MFNIENLEVAWDEARPSAGAVRRSAQLDRMLRDQDE